MVSPKLYGTISLLQTLASPLNVRVVQEAATHVGSVYLLAEVFLAAMSIWNLDFFHNVMPDKICLRINSLQLLALDYNIPDSSVPNDSDSCCLLHTAATLPWHL